MLVDERLWALFKRHWRYTLTYWSVFFSFGLCIAFLGPTILDLRCQTQSTNQQITWVFFAQQFFLLLGSTLGGLCKRTLPSSLSGLCCCTLIISLVFAIIPLCHHVALLSVAMALTGTVMGVIDTIANQQLVKLYQKDSAVFLQALHFFIGLGALVSPLVADPFLAEDSCDMNGNWTTNSSSSPPSDLEYLHNAMPGKGTVPLNTSHHPLHTEGVLTTKVSFAFWIMALINLPIPLAVFILMYHERLLPCFNPSPPLLSRDSLSSTSPTASENSEQGHGGAFACFNLKKLQGRPPSFFLLHVLGGTILFITDGIIGSYAGFVYTYAVSPPLSMGHKTAGCLDSVFWASITAGRLAFIYLSYRYTATRLLIFSLVSVILVQCMMLLLYYSQVFLFIGTSLLGLCISSVFPCMLAYTEDILNYKGCATTVLVTSASAGEMVMQVAVGLVIHSQGSYTFLLSGMIASFIGFFLYLFLLYVERIHRNYQPDSPKDMDMTEKAVSGEQ